MRIRRNARVMDVVVTQHHVADHLSAVGGDVHPVSLAVANVGVLHGGARSAGDATPLVVTWSIMALSPVTRMLPATETLRTVTLSPRISMLPPTSAF